MDDNDIFTRLALALAIGLLLGLERGWHGRDEAEGERIAGIRTFALTGIFGGVSGWLAILILPVFPALAILALGGFLAVSYWLSARTGDDLGITTEIALLLTFVLGVLSVVGETAPTVAVAVVAALLLSMKPVLHRWIKQIDQLELEAGLQLALISVVILPLLPNEGYGPGGVVNPYELWWAVVIVASLSFVGYVAIRLAGANAGILATGLFGGLASSTTTTLTLARLVRLHDSIAIIAAAGIIVSGSVTFLRILALVAIFEPSLVAPLALPMGLMAATGLTSAAVLYAFAGRGHATPGKIVDTANPLALATALTFGFVLAFILIGTHFLHEWLGTTGVFTAAALSGVTDVDALTISVSQLVQDSIQISDGAAAIFIAATVNTAVKGAIALFVGGKALGLRVSAVYVAVITVGFFGLWVS